MGNYTGRIKIQGVTITKALRPRTERPPNVGLKYTDNAITAPRRRGSFHTPSGEDRAWRAHKANAEPPYNAHVVRLEN